MSERLPWCNPRLFDEGTREEQAAMIAYAVEREAEDWQRLQAMLVRVFAASMGAKLKVD